MPFVRDHGTCCLFLPLKLGVGLISMIIFAHSILCILAVITSDIRFQPNGYNQHFYKVPSIIGVFGLVIGFVGLLGAYDDQISQLKLFNRYLAIKVICMLAAMIADLVSLHYCEDWTKHHTRDEQPQMYALSEQEVCPWARTSYILGCTIDISVWIYFTIRCFSYEYQIAHNPPYKIDFGREKYDVDARWQFYHVKDPRYDMLEEMRLHEREKEAEESPLYYGSVPLNTKSFHYGPDGQRILVPPPVDGLADTFIGPDEQRIPGPRLSDPLADTRLAGR